MATLRLAIDAGRLVHEAQRAKAALAGVQTGATGAFNAVKRSADLVLAPLKLVTGALVTVKASMLALGTASIQAGAQFQQQMAMVSTMLDETTMSLLPRYEAGLRDLKARYGESTATLSKGLYDILSASIDTAHALEVLEVATVAARAGLTDTGTAADAITTILNAYQLSADKAGRVSDLLFAIVKRGKTTFPELAGDIGKVAAISAVAGLSLEELGAALATMTRAGVKTDIAITALRAILTTFLQPTEESQKAAKELGFELSSTTLKAEGLLGVLQKLTDASPEQVAALMPNVRGFIGFAAALKQAEGQAYDLDFMLRASGRTMEAYRKMTNTLTHEWTLFKAAVGGLRGAFAWGFLDQARLLVRDLKEGAAALKGSVTEAGRAFGQELERGRAAMLAAVDVAAEIGAQMQRAFEVGQGGSLLLKVFQTGAGLVGEAILAAFRASLALWKVIGRVLADGILEVLYASGIPGLEGIGRQKRAGDVARSLEGLAEAQLRDLAATYGVGLRTKTLAPEQPRMLGMGQPVPVYTMAEKSAARLRDEIAQVMAGGTDQMVRSALETINRLYGTELQLDKGYRITETLERAGQTLGRELSRIGDKAVASVQEMADEVAAVTGEAPVEVVARWTEQYGKHLDAGRRMIAEWKQTVGMEMPEPSAIVEPAFGGSETAKAADGTRAVTAEALATREQVGKLMAAIDAEMEIIGRLNESRQRSRDVVELQVAAEKAYGAQSAETIRILDEYGRKLELLRDQERLVETADSIGDSFANAFERAVTGAEGFSEALRAMGREIAALVMRQTVLQGVSDWISGGAQSAFGGLGSAFGGLLSGRGNVFQHGQLVPFAAGGVVDRPVVFPMAQGTRRGGLMGEAGPEAVMPLRRGRDGKLGVAAEGTPTVENHTRIVNVLDPSVAADYMQSAAGEKVIVNVIRRNRNALRGVLG